MTTSTVPTFAEFAALLTSEQQRILDAMDGAIASNDRAQYAAQHALFIELGAAFDALWKHKETTRKAQRPACDGPALSDFTAWLQATQRSALAGMRVTEGEAFSEHLEAFTDATTAVGMVLQFQAAMREAQHAASTTGGAA